MFVLRLNKLSPFGCSGFYGLFKTVGDCVATMANCQAVHKPPFNIRIGNLPSRYVPSRSEPILGL
nr:MAG TPA: hypothetical protein [Caudoviricetes sp.]